MCQGSVTFQHQPVAAHPSGSVSVPCQRRVLSLEGLPFQQGLPSRSSPHCPGERVFLAAGSRSWSDDPVLLSQSRRELVMRGWGGRVRPLLKSYWSSSKRGGRAKDLSYPQNLFTTHRLWGFLLRFWSYLLLIRPLNFLFSFSWVEQAWYKRTGGSIAFVIMSQSPCY